MTAAVLRDMIYYRGVQLTGYQLIGRAIYLEQILRTKSLENQPELALIIWDNMLLNLDC